MTKFQKDLLIAEAAKLLPTPVAPAKPKFTAKLVERNYRINLDRYPDATIYAEITIGLRVIEEYFVCCAKAGVKTYEPTDEEKAVIRAELYNHLHG